MTYPILANVTLLQDPWISSLNAVSIVFGALVGAGSGIISSYLTRRSEKQREQETRKTILIQEQWNVYSRLRGIQVRIAQDFIDLYQKRISEVYQERSSKIHEEEVDRRLHVEEAQKLNKSMDDISNRFAQHRQTFYEVVALITILFPDESQLHEKINSFQYHISVFENRYKKSDLLKEVENINTFTELDGWQDAKLQGINRLVVDVVDCQFKDLLNYLKSRLNIIVIK